MPDRCGTIKASSARRRDERHPGPRTRSSPVHEVDNVSISLLISLWKGGITFLAAAGAALPRPAGAGDTLRIAVHLPASSVDARAAEHGVRLGIEEAERTGAMLGLPVRLVEAGAGVVIAGGGGEQCGERLAAADTAALVLNVSCRDDAIRDARRAKLFHVEVSDSTYLRAGAVAALWLPELERYGAAQLNERFVARFGEPMTAPAWAGWMAVKIALEAALRARAVDGAALAATLAARRMRFDGHKGRALAFRAADHQLVQPLYRRGAGGEVEETIP